MLSTKTRRCPHCKAKDLPPGYRLHPHCVDGWLAVLREKDEAKKRKAQLAKAKAERAHDKQRKRALKLLSDFRADAQVAFNAYIRARDAALPCVSCGEANPPMKPGGQWDAGHFLSRGAYPELAFNEDNCHKQCKSCNAGSGRFSHKARTVAEKYEDELLERIGHDRLAALRAPHPPNHYRRADYEALVATYKAKAKELKEKSE